MWRGASKSSITADYTTRNGKKLRSNAQVHFPPLSLLLLIDCAVFLPFFFATNQIVLADPGYVASILDDAANLKWMQSTWAGVNPILSGTSKRNYTLTRLGGCFGPLMAGQAFRSE